ncbi:hypothetical protein [Burkholderia sp. Ac-20365]|uniref:hypothetical protein n=1 Tax=Burkholderia sp. Ac-20365 TaxID=2703897 RepID=UPI00197BF89F|nr:hypothetical protein [Burkholderia sp. Ac-20365]MBN3760897.1 hypothetical protein [Burkholderia sp. Ac-20365]
MTMLAARAFRAALIGRLELPFGGNVAAGTSAEALAREFHDGTVGLLRVLEEESIDTNERGRCAQFSLCSMLMECWTAKGDDAHLKAATGRTRHEWLAAPLWKFAESTPQLTEADACQPA